MTTTSARTKSGSKTKANPNSGSSPKGRGGRPAGGKTSRQRAGDAVADRIIELLDQGRLPPWERDWRDSTNGTPRNAVSMKPYRGVNRWMTLLTHMAMGYQDPRWLTCRQAEALGGHVRKGERSTEIVFWKRVPVRDRETANRETANRERHPSGRGGETPHLPHAPVLPASSTWSRPRTAGSSPRQLHPRQLQLQLHPQHLAPRRAPPAHRSPHRLRKGVEPLPHPTLQRRSPALNPGQFLHVHPQALSHHPSSQLPQQPVEQAPARSTAIFGFPHCPHLSLNWAKWAF